MRLHRFVLMVVLAVALTVPAMALSNRVFVKTTGTDAGTCPITAPCRTFAYGMTQVAPAGEIIAQDTGGYGPVTIGQAVTIVAAPGATAFVAAAGTGVTVTAGASDVVTLRGLAITAQGGAIGIDFQTGFVLNVENCILNGFSGNAINFSRAADNSAPKLNVIGSVVRNSGKGLYVANAGPGSPAGGPPPNISYVTIANSSFTGNATGIHASDNSRVTVSDCVVAASTTVGLTSSAGADYSTPQLNLERLNVSRNAVGVHSGSAAGNVNQIPRGVVRLANCTIVGNDIGIEPTADGTILSRVANSVTTNTIEGNGVDGTPTTTYTAK